MGGHARARDSSPRRVTKFLVDALNDRCRTSRSKNGCATRSGTAEDRGQVSPGVVRGTQLRQPLIIDWRLHKLRSIASSRGGVKRETEAPLHRSLGGCKWRGRISCSNRRASACLSGIQCDTDRTWCRSWGGDAARRGVGLCAQRRCRSPRRRKERRDLAAAVLFPEDHNHAAGSRSKHRAIVRIGAYGNLIFA